MYDKTKTDTTAEWDVLQVLPGRYTHTVGWIAAAIEQVFNTNKPELKPITFFDKLIPNQLQQVIMWVHQNETVKAAGILSKLPSVCNLFPQWNHHRSDP